MQDRELYRQILGIESPWKVARVELRRADGEVHIFLEHDEQVRWPCRQCSAVCALHDHQPERRWRHLDTCQYRTILHARPPRSDCSEHGPRVVRLPWAEASSRFTALFEALAISWLKEASQQGIAELLALSWDEIHGILERAVQRGLERRAAEPIPTWASTRRASASAIAISPSSTISTARACCTIASRDAARRAWTAFGRLERRATRPSRGRRDGLVGYLRYLATH